MVRTNTRIIKSIQKADTLVRAIESVSHQNHIRAVGTADTNRHATTVAVNFPI